MSLLSAQVQSYMERSSWIRRMFEAGIELKKQFGEDQVCDFSLGNPDLPPPACVCTALHEIADEADQPFAFGYMPNFGYPHVREALAREVSREQGLSVAPADLVITCGAAGAINAFYRAVLEPGDEVLCPAPYFVEYGFYVENHGGVLKTAPAHPGTFDLDVAALEAAITPKTRVVLINSPNNPTGVVYPRASLVALAGMLTKKSADLGRPIFLLADEPYRFLAFDGIEVPSLLPLYPHTVVVSSFSKNLSLAGARVGYALVNPALPGKEELVGGIILANRILGFVNAPALAQKLLAKTLGSQVDAQIYAGRRDAMRQVLDAAGYAYPLPRGAFYFFPQAPGGDDVAFVQLLLEERILAVPGKGFGCPGHFRLAFCVGENVIRRAEGGFKRALEKAGK
ncbi:MAG: pyridoxal phosphate-dependent aminotransferase [Proteobacteria bacterium]|nr:pyridoxal phosphate-dependent aminotransferase [Pseudomonadota bacterium]MBU1595028.1 pyridoxal phosphate-dependent aminotransferase [Pseudomonadota bacterium]